MQNAYAMFFCAKGLLNMGAAIVGLFYLGDIKMAGFWLLLSLADFWFGYWSLP